MLIIIIIDIFGLLFLRILVEGIVLLLWSYEYANDQKKLDKVGMSDIEGTGREGRFCRSCCCIGS